MSSSEGPILLVKEGSAWDVVGVDKWILMIVLTLASMFFGLLPYLVISHSSSFFEAPSAELLTLFGFCMMYLIEEVVNLFLHFPTKCEIHQDEHSHDECGGPLEDEFDGCCCNGGSVRNACQHSTLMRPMTDMKGSSCSVHLDESPAEVPVKNPLSLSLEEKGMAQKSVSRLSLVTSGSTISCLISVLALSFHAVMEGIAVGGRESADLWMIFGAIASHKLIIAFSLGIEFVRSNGSLKSAIFSLFLFAIVTPIGIVLGSIASSNTFRDSRWPINIEGMTVGTLLYVIFFEILITHDLSHHPEEETGSGSHRHSDWFRGPLKFIGVILGISVAACLLHTMHVPHGHSGSHA